MMTFLDFDNPFVLGAFWLGVLVLLTGAYLLVRWQRRTLRNELSELRTTLTDQKLANVALDGTMNALDERLKRVEERAKHRDTEIRLERRISLLDIATAQDRDANSRFKAQVLARQVMALEAWLIDCFGLLEAHRLAIPTPSPVIAKVRNEDEFYEAIDLARNQRYLDLVKGFEASIGDGLWEGITDAYLTLLHGHPVPSPEESA